MLHIVIPAYNEELRLPRTLRELRRFVREHASVLQPVEVVVVDNLSTDATAAVALEASTDAVPVRVVTCAVRGKGAAVAAGVAATGATSSDVVVFMDADGATHLDALLESWRLLALGADVAIGSRAAEGSDTAVRHSRLREAGALRYRALTAKVVPGIRDTQCGFKALRGDLAVTVFAALRTTGFSFDVELLARLQRGGAVIEEFPVQWADVPGSTFAPLRHGAGSFLNLAVIAWLLRAAPAGPATAVPALPLAPAPALLVAVEA
ncbi:glycosyltransferase [Nocardioides rubriscoriae]|uniref:glycosyltransferase n=1 Tax=Nocardioides rubriscoriae TaxID=642762 RepID=UPI0011DF928E|nr:glycosyltransferase [Nocardioides rubriscoriae]